MACRLCFQHYAVILHSINRIVKNLTSKLPPLRSGRRLDQLHERIRNFHDSLRTEEVYVYWVRLFIRFHRLHPPADMGAAALRQGARMQAEG